MFSRRKYEYPPHFPDRKNVEKIKMFHHEIPSEANAYNDRETAAEESSRRNGIFTTSGYSIHDLVNRLEAHRNI
jgi:hypothetical protein